MVYSPDPHSLIQTGVFPVGEGEQIGRSGRQLMGLGGMLCPAFYSTLRFKEGKGRWKDLEGGGIGAWRFMEVAKWQRR